MSICEACGRDKPAWCSYRLCSRCHKSAKKVTKADVADVATKNVKVVNSNQIITFRTKRDRIWRWAKAHVRHVQNKETGALTKYWNLIWINPRMSRLWTPETIAQTINAESIHLALFSLGMGRENTQLDKFGLHSWKTSEDMLKEYYGLSVDKFIPRE